MPKLIELAKALLIAIVILIVNVAISYVVVAFYAYLIVPGQDQEFYEAAAQQIAPWSSVFAGVFLFFTAVYVMVKREPTRNATGFALSVWAIYAAIDLLILGSQNMLISLAPIVSISLASKLVAAVAGGYWAKKKR